MATYPGGIPSLTRPAAGNPANDGSATDATVVVDAMSDEIEAIAGELGVNPSGGSATVVARLDALDSTVSGKAASSHTHVAADTTDFAETVRDTIGSALVAGTNVTITVDDVADTITIDAAGGGGLTEEQAEDIVNGLLVAGSNISLTYDDVANSLTVAATGLEAAGTAAALVDDLSGVSDVATARTNLGLGSAATAATGDFEAAGAVAAHTGDTVDAHDASAISVDAAAFAGNLTTGATDVQSALDEIDALALGGSATGILHYVSGTAAPSAGLGSTDDWAVNDNSVLYRKISGTWTISGRLDNFAVAFTAAGWSAPYPGNVRPPVSSATGWVKTNLAAQSSSTINFAGSSAGASAVLAFPTAGRLIHSAYARFAVTTMPVGGTMSFGIGVTPFAPTYPLINVTPAGAVTVTTGSGTTTLKTLTGTCVAGDVFHVQWQPGAVLINWAQSSGVTRDIYLYASEFASQYNAYTYGLGIGVYGTGTLTAGVVNFNNTEVCV